jgi:hypothetical protein
MRRLARRAQDGIGSVQTGDGARRRRRRPRAAGAAAAREVRARGGESGLRAGAAAAAGAPGVLWELRDGRVCGCFERAAGHYLSRPRRGVPRRLLVPAGGAGGRAGPRAPRRGVSGFSLHTIGPRLRTPGGPPARGGRAKGGGGGAGINEKASSPRIGGEGGLQRARRGRGRWWLLLHLRPGPTGAGAAPRAPRNASCRVDRAPAPAAGGASGVGGGSGRQGRCPPGGGVLRLCGAAAGAAAARGRGAGAAPGAAPGPRRVRSRT